MKLGEFGEESGPSIGPYGDEKKDRVYRGESFISWTPLNLTSIFWIDIMHCRVYHVSSLPMSFSVSSISFHSSQKLTGCGFEQIWILISNTYLCLGKIFCFLGLDVLICKMGK